MPARRPAANPTRRPGTIRNTSARRCAEELEIERRVKAGESADRFLCPECDRWRIEVELCAQLRALGPNPELPHERMPVDSCRTEVRLVALDVVDDPNPRSRLDTVRVLGESQDQWKYWPPSITIVWPVTNEAPGPQRKTTAPTTSSGC